MTSLDLHSALPSARLQTGAVPRGHLSRDVAALSAREFATPPAADGGRDFGRDLRAAQTPAPVRARPSQSEPRADHDGADAGRDPAPAPTAVAVQSRHAASHAKDEPASDGDDAATAAPDAAPDGAPVAQAATAPAAKPAQKTAEAERSAAGADTTPGAGVALPDAQIPAAPIQVVQAPVLPQTVTAAVAGAALPDALAAGLRPVGGAKGAVPATDTSTPVAQADTGSGEALPSDAIPLATPETHVGPRGHKPAGAELANVGPSIDVPRPDAGPLMAPTATVGQKSQTATPIAGAAAPADQPAGASGGALPQGLTLAQSVPPQSTPAPMGTPAAPINTTLPAWESALANTVAGHAAKSLGGLDLTLSPEHLGGVQIRIDMADGAARVTIVTQTTEAQNLFQTAQHRLAEAFDHAGLTLASQQSATQDGGAQGNNPRPGGGQGPYQTTAQGDGAQTGAGQSGAGAARGRLSAITGAFGPNDGGPSHATGPAQQGLLNILA